MSQSYDINSITEEDRSRAVNNTNLSYIWILVKNTFN